MGKWEDVDGLVISAGLHETRIDGISQENGIWKVKKGFTLEWNERRYYLNQGWWFFLVFLKKT